MPFFLLWYTGGEEHKIQAAITFAPFHKTLPWRASHPFTHWFSLLSPSHLVFLIALCPVSSLYLLASLFPLEEAVIILLGRRQKILYLNAACKVFQVKGTLADFCTKRNLIDVRWRLVQLETIILTMTRWNHTYLSVPDITQTKVQGSRNSAASNQLKLRCIAAVLYLQYWSEQHFYTAGMILLQPIPGLWETEPVVVNIHQ